MRSKVFLIPMLAVSVATACQFILRENFETDMAMRFTFTLAILVSNMLGGYLSGIITTFLSCVAADLFFLAPVYAFGVYNYPDQVRLVTLLVQGLVITAVIQYCLERVKKEIKSSLKTNPGKEQTPREIWFGEIVDSKGLDLLAAIPMMAAYAFSLWKVAPATELDFNNVLALFQSGQWIPGWTTALVDLQSLAMVALYAVIIFGLIRRSTPVKRNLNKKMGLVAVVGTMSPVLFSWLKPAELGETTSLIAISLVFFGTVTMAIGFWFLGDSIGVNADVRQVKKRGIYALVRHPIYLGEEFFLAGIALHYFSVQAALIFLFCSGLQYIRMIFEEKVLSESSEEYQKYQTQTWRLVPYLY